MVNNMETNAQLWLGQVTADFTASVKFPGKAQGFYDHCCIQNGSGNTRN
jgi:regulation of enolase protein 1 (concanavalin A-like superfamily)